MLTNKEYSQIVTALFYSTSDGKTVNLAAANSILRIFTKDPGEVQVDDEKKALIITPIPKRKGWFTRTVEVDVHA